MRTTFKVMATTVTRLFVSRIIQRALANLAPTNGEHAWATLTNGNCQRHCVSWTQISKDYYTCICISTHPLRMCHTKCNYHQHIQLTIVQPIPIHNNNSCFNPFTTTTKLLSYVPSNFMTTYFI